MYKTKKINATYKIIVQCAITALQDTSIQYTFIMFGNQKRYLAWAVPQDRFNVFIYFFQFVFNISFFRSI